MPQGIKVEVGQRLRTEQRLTPQMLQSTKVLQMTGQELMEYLSRAAEENPLLEREESAVARREYEALRRRVSWLDSTAAPAPYTYREAGGPARELESLEAFLHDQLERLGLENRLHILCRYIVSLLDEDGYLAEEDWDSLRQLPVPHPMSTRALELVQSLEPAGVGARSLGECLTLQLRRRGEEDGVSLAIVEGYLPQVGRRQYGAIARALHAPLAQVEAACRRIAALEPHPGRDFAAGEEPVYVRPDVFIVEAEEGYEVVLNDYYLPRLTLSSYYARLLREGPDEETAAYLKEKLRHAQWLLQSLSRRGDTLRRCAESILESQLPFFRGETGELSAMSLRALAQELELHPSTVSRCLRGKYLQCRRGTYPLRYFFSLPSGGLSRQAVQQRLAMLIRKEDSAHPLSDRKLAELLSAQGVEVARRTVAKYREAMGIPAASARRR